ncbi:MAG: DUF971 domain-containing protein [Phycisphaerales bacterium]|nr:DUF971 domain-containing protein [Phycisphaerales bacterium]
MDGDATRPVEIELQRPSTLRMRWADGLVGVISLPVLRRACPCATCRTEREERNEGALPMVPAGGAAQRMTAIETLELVGHYALRPTWADGHTSGIYSYELLRALCVEATGTQSAEQTP